jgi:hypothetical protein
MRMPVCYLDFHKVGLSCYVVIHIEDLLRPLQLFHFHLWLSLVVWWRSTEGKSIEPDFSDKIIVILYNFSFKPTVINYCISVVSTENIVIKSVDPLQYFYVLVHHIPNFSALSYYILLNCIKFVRTQFKLWTVYCVMLDMPIRGSWLLSQPHKFLKRLSTVLYRWLMATLLLVQ